MHDYSMVSPMYHETRVQRERLNIEPFTHSEQSYGYVFAHIADDETQRETQRDRNIIRTARNNDYLVYAKHDNIRHLVGIVRKESNSIRYRRVTDNGLGSWYVLSGYTKRVPERAMHMMFGVPEYVNVYMVDVKHVLHVVERDDDMAIHDFGPHDRRPQEWKYKAKRPKRRGW